MLRNWIKINNLLGCCIWLLAANITFAQGNLQQIVPNRTNDSSQLNKPYVIYISADGFRSDFADKYQATNLIKFRGEGVQAESMKPSFPSVTFSNHYTLATGMYPSHHGLVNNSFYDPKRKELYVRTNPTALSDSTWYGGIPIWALAEQQKMVAAAFYWIGSETAVQGIRPTYWYSYSTQISIDERLNAVKTWLALPPESRPHIINLYFPEVDVAGHHFGPESKEIAKAVKFIDSCVGELNEIAKATNLPVNFVFVSDHGMINVDNVNTLSKPDVLNNDKVFVPNGDALIHIYVKNKKEIKKIYSELKASAIDFDVMLASKTPKRWHYRSKDNKDGRIGDILLIPHFPKVFNFTGKPTSIGKHGFDNDMPEMQATFYAWGPAFKNGLKIPAFENVHIYPLLAKVLGLKYHHKIDGKIQVLQAILK